MMGGPDDIDAITLLERLGRLAAADEWSEQLNPAQRAALSYLARANRFSRSPSQVADYLSATRGTVSQTLKALARKGFVRERRPGPDRHSISYEVTRPGRRALSGGGALRGAMQALSPRDRRALVQGLQQLLGAAVNATGGRSFGACATCRHHRHDGDGRFCELLAVSLSEAEAHLICHEHETPG